MSPTPLSMHIRTPSQARMAILRTPAHNFCAAFSLTRVVTLPRSVSSFTTPVSSVCAFVTSSLHLFHLIRHDPEFSFPPFLPTGGLPVYLNKSGRVDFLNPKRSLFIYRHDHRSWSSTPSRSNGSPPDHQSPVTSYSPCRVPDSTPAEMIQIHHRGP